LISSIDASLIDDYSIFFLLSSMITSLFHATADAVFFFRAASVSLLFLSFLFRFAFRFADAPVPFFAFAFFTSAFAYFALPAISPCHGYFIIFTG
jgi:hypothetical protein